MAGIPLLGLFLIALLSSPALAQGHWPAELALPFEFLSLDSTPIEVLLRNPNDAEPTHQAILHVPRAVMMFVNGYDARKLAQLPDRVVTNEFSVGLVFPDGEPLSIRATRIAKEQKISLIAAFQSLRQSEYKGHIHYSGPNGRWEELSRQDMDRFKFTDSFEGLRYAPPYYYLGEDGVDNFFSAFCYPEATPVYFCKTEMRIGPGITASVDFPDFRFHGGRGYLNERAHRFGEIVCSYADPPC